MTPLAPLAGLRLGALQPVDAVGYEQILVTTPGEAAVTQGVLRASAEVGRLALDGAIPWVLSSGGGYTDGGTGRVRLAGGAWIGRRRTWQVGVELGVNPFDAPRASVLAWATRARDVVPGSELLFAASWTHPEGWLAARIAFGPHWSTFVGSWPSYLPIVGDLTLVGQAPIVGRLAVLAEADLTADPSWLTVRPAARVALTPFTVDLGIQAPVPTLLETPTFQPFVQVRWWQPPDELTPLRPPPADEPRPPRRFR